MKISYKVLKRCNVILCIIPFIYVIISDNLNIHIDKFENFVAATIICVFYMLLNIGYKLSNKPYKKKNLRGLLLGNLLIVAVLI